jgi:carbon-monoxide dehydrogenase medium subunit
MIPLPVLVGQRSRSRIAPFRLHRPATIEDAVAAMAAAPAGAAYMAGGIDVINRMKSGFAPADVVHLGRIAELAGIDGSGESLHIGACATHRAVAESEIVRARAPALARCWRSIAHPRVRCKGTAGGNFMARESAYDVTLMLLAASAVLTFAGADSKTIRLPIADAGAQDALLTSIEVLQPHQLALSVDCSLQPALKLVLGSRRIDGRLHDVRIAIGGAYARAFVLPIDLSAFGGGIAGQAAAIAHAVVTRLPRPLDDWRASAAYRQRMIGVLLRRLLEKHAR